MASKKTIVRKRATYNSQDALPKSQQVVSITVKQKMNRELAWAILRRRFTDDQILAMLSARQDYQERRQDIGGWSIPTS